MSSGGGKIEIPSGVQQMSRMLERFRKNEIDKAETKIQFYQKLAGFGILLVMIMKPLMVSLPFLAWMFSIAVIFAGTFVFLTVYWSTWKRQCEEGLIPDCRQSLVASIDDGFLCL